MMKDMRKTVSVGFKILIVLMATVGILLQCGVGTDHFSLDSFRMFTTLSNLAVLLFFLVDLLFFRKKRDARIQRVRTIFKFSITMSILLTGLVACFILRGMFDHMDQLTKIGLFFLHDLVPAATVCDWLFFDEKGRTDRKMPLQATLFPLLYVAVTMILSPFVPVQERYPYPFLNVDQLGIGMVVLNILFLSFAFLAAGFLGVWLDHRIMAHVRHRSLNV